MLFLFGDVNNLNGMKFLDVYFIENMSVNCGFLFIVFVVDIVDNYFYEN